MYAIAFHLDAELLRRLYLDSNWNNAYSDIRLELETRGFRREQGGVYFGNDNIRATDCVKATMDLDALFPWFKPSVRDIRMMQITEVDTLMDFLGYEAGRPAARDRKR